MKETNWPRKQTGDCIKNEWKLARAKLAFIWNSEKNEANNKKYIVVVGFCSNLKCFRACVCVHNVKHASGFLISLSYHMLFTSHFFHRMHALNKDPLNKNITQHWRSLINYKWKLRAILWLLFIVVTIKYEDLMKNESNIKQTLSTSLRMDMQMTKEIIKKKNQRKKITCEISGFVETENENSFSFDMHSTYINFQETWKKCNGSVYKLARLQ